MINGQLLKVQRAKMVGDPTILYVIFIQPFIFALLFGFLHQTSGSDGERMFTVFIGVGQMTMWQVLLYAGGIIVRHEFNRERTIFYSLLSKTNVYWIWAKRLFFCLLLASPGLIISILVGVLLFGASIPMREVTFIFIGVLLFLLTLYSIGLPIILLLFLTTQGGKIIQTITYPIFLLSGMIVSVDYFPAIIRGIAYLFPITWSIHWLQNVILFNEVNWFAFIQTIVISIFYLVMSRFLYVFIMGKIKLRGEINL
ncbi:ABC transporter permease [Bacillus salitolerans]|uniref:ABC transporter permease n=1 Tax=Bacillus salitolerans TaxID=1437434 RepID=A0ABW4LT79_9BACI